MTSNKLIGLATGLTIMVLSAASFAADTTTPVPGKTYQLVSRYSGKCLDVTDHSYTDGTQLQQWNCTGKPNQKFLMIDAYKGAVQLKAQESGQFVKVANESLDNGGIVTQSTNNSGNSPRMILSASADGSYTVKFTNSGKCLDVAGPSTAPGAKIHQWDCHGGSSQDWRLVEQTDGMGQQAWNAANTSLFIDSFNRLYRQDFNDSSLKGVDKASGRELWSFKSTSYEVPYPVCNDQGHVYLVGNGILKAVHPDSGKLTWNYDSKDGSGSLYCVEGYNSVFFASSTSDNGKFRSIDRETGKLRWEYAPQGFASFIGKKGQNVYVTVYYNSKTKLVNLESGTGRVKWSRDIQEGEWVLDGGKGEIYVNHSNSVTKVHPETGKNAWVYGDSDVSIIWNPAGIPYVRHGRDIVRLNDANGSVQWSTTIPESVGSSNSTSLVFKNADLMIRTTDTASNQAHTILFNEKGQKLWDTWASDANASAYEDNAGKLFYQGPRSLASINRATGLATWTFQREFPIDNEAFYSAQTYGNDVYLLYGAPAGRYPSMGIVRLDANSGAQQWDVWTGTTTSLLGADAGLLFTSRMFGGGIYVYKR